MLVEARKYRSPSSERGKDLLGNQSKYDNFFGNITNAIAKNSKMKNKINNSLLMKKCKENIKKRKLSQN